MKKILYLTLVVLVSLSPALSYAKNCCCVSAESSVEKTSEMPCHDSGNEKISTSKLKNDSSKICLDCDCEMISLSKIIDRTNFNIEQLDFKISYYPLNSVFSSSLADQQDHPPKA